MPDPGTRNRDRGWRLRGDHERATTRRCWRGSTPSMRAPKPSQKKLDRLAAGERATATNADRIDVPSAARR